MWTVEIQLGSFYLDLFEDESISLTKKLSDFEDLDTVWGDFSQSFTVPATVNNREAFDYYHRIDRISNFDPSRRNQAILFINRIPYSTGVITLQEVGFKGYEPQFYKIQFFSETISLKDRIGETKMYELDFSDFDHSNSVATLGSLLDGTNGFKNDGTISASSSADVARYVMGSVSNAWQWNTTGFQRQNRRNISNAAYTANNNLAGISNTEVRPAFYISFLLEKIFSDFGFDLNIDSNLANETLFNQSALWFSREGSTVFGVEYEMGQSIVYDSADSFLGGGTPATYVLNDYSSEVSNSPSSYNKNTGVFTAYATGNYSFEFSCGDLGSSANAGAVGGFTSPRLDYSFAKSTDGGVTYATIPLTSGVLSFSTKTGSASGLPLNAGDKVRIEIDDISQGGQDAKFEFKPDGYFKLTAQPLAASTNVVSSFAPNIKVIDFINGIVKAYNALLYWNDVDQQFELVRRSDFYDNGTTYDITQYVDMTTRTMRPNTFYKEYEFIFTKPDDFIGSNFYKQNGKYYGNTTYDLGNYLGDVYQVRLPFQPAQDTEIVSTNATTGATTGFDLYCQLLVDDAFGKVDGGARIGMIQAGEASASWAIREDSTVTNNATGISYYKLAAIGASGEFAFLFNNEFDLEYNQVSLDNLLTQNYASYINKLFNKNVRIIQIEALIPYPVLQQIKLNDKVLISDNRFILSSINVDIKTGKSRLTMINDFDAY